MVARARKSNNSTKKIVIIISLIVISLSLLAPADLLVSSSSFVSKAFDFGKITGFAPAALPITYPMPVGAITVCSSGCDNTTIQGGLNMAVSGDYIFINDHISIIDKRN